MRTLFFLLLLANIAFALYIQLEPVSSGRTQPVLQLRPEKTGPVPAPVPAVENCLEWGTFLDVDRERVETAIAAQQLGDKVTRQTMGKVPVYWMHIPPLNSRLHAERKIGELKNLGVTHYYHVQDDSKWNNAISMGFFHDIEDARNLMASLRSKGVRSAIIGARNLEQVKFVVRAPSEDVTKKMTELSQKFPGTELKTVTCEAPL
ncbi:MAG: hypothetical protein L0H12_03685 [Nitrosospira sp.]|nr:hypothetical protein [Nitrosospira sp.]MDN5881718.1 hypothetical protein [Nitrosospira sp.]MDN5935497.1 hypothetical protein [Nitrosospira sp.]